VWIISDLSIQSELDTTNNITCGRGQSLQAAVKHHPSLLPFQNCRPLLNHSIRPHILNLILTRMHVHVYNTVIEILPGNGAKNALSYKINGVS
jgi:hypothetical protein